MFKLVSILEDHLTKETFTTRGYFFSDLNLQSGSCRITLTSSNSRIKPDYIYLTITDAPRKKIMVDFVTSSGNSFSKTFKDSDAAEQFIMDNY
ncbi:hypothetical protein GCM10027347_59510 [Larkinella harenae]